MWPQKGMDVAVETPAETSADIAQSISTDKSEREAHKGGGNTGAENQGGERNHTSRKLERTQGMTAEIKQYIHKMTSRTNKESDVGQFLISMQQFEKYQIFHWENYHKEKLRRLKIVFKTAIFIH